MSANQEKVVDVVVPLDFTYNYRVGAYVERYIKGLGDKKIFGVKCAGDDSVVVPPRKYCGSCNKVMDEWVEVGPEGTIENFTVAHVKLEKGVVEKVDTEYVVALVKLDGATSLLPAKIEGVSPAAVEMGMRVKAVFKDPATDSVEDLSHFEPAG
jgi:uncharacterized protein